MKFLLDQDVYFRTAQFLTLKGHDVLKAADLGMQQAADEDLLKCAAREGRLFVTRDRDYGNLVFVRNIKVGVLYLRAMPVSLEAVHTELERILNTYSESDLKSAFIVVEPGGHRFRRL